MDISVGFREVVPDQTNVEKWTDFTLNTGGTQSTLQDFKVAEKTGGYSYGNQKIYYTRNRFIYWRVCNDSLELVEQSLDITLTGNRVRYKFTDTPVLDGVTIWEVPGAVFVLVATVSSVHRLSFPHPDVIHSKEHVYPRAGVEYSSQSIFAEATLNDARSPATFHVVNNTSANSLPPHTSASGMSADGENCLFALAYSSGTILLVRQNVLTGAIVVAELNQHSDVLMPRFLSRALRGKNNEDSVPVSLLLHPVGEETLLLSLCRDGNIRAWSTQRQNCCVVTDFPANSSQGAQSHKLKKAIGVKGELYIGVLHCFSSHCVIQILQFANSSNLKLNLLETVYVPQGKDVVDFAITGNLEVWTVLRSATGDTTLAVSRDGLWLNCELETPWERDEFPVDSDVEPKQAYLDFIFHPGRFPVAVINKALSIYRKANIITDMGVPTQVLKERVSAVVDAQIYGEMREHEYSAEELLQLQNSAWQKFYSCVVEYYEGGTRPLGLLVLSHPTTPPSNYNDSSSINKSAHEDTSMVQGEDDDTENEGEMLTSGVLVIKKSYISLVRPMDSVESIAFNAEELSQLSINDGVSPDLARLISVLSFIDDNLPEEGKLNFEKCLKQLKTPIQTVVELFAEDFNVGDEDTMSSLDLINNVAVNLENITDIEKAIGSFLDLLDVGQPDLDDGLAVERSKWILHLGHLYGSQLGMSLVSASFHQIVLIRCVLCRNLLILEQLMQSNSFQQFLPSSRRLQISSDILERTSHLIQCYFLLLWISQTPIHPLQLLDTMENSVSILKLNEARNPLLVPHYSNTNRNITLIHLFLQSSAATTVRLLLSHREIPLHLLPLWRHSFLPYVHVLMQLVWPICSNTIFPEFLLFSGQHLHVQEYTRLLSKWCHSNSHTRKFLLACSLLDTGEHNKAFDLFNMASHGVLINNFIRRRVVREDDAEDRKLVLYYVQVMKLFEQQGLHNLVIELAEKAITVARPNEPELATLHSVAFLHQLELGRDQEAFNALLANPDAERKKDCLQQLVVTLVDARRLNVLLAFCYDGVRPELERIVEARARSLEVRDNAYYSLAYSYHVQRGSMRKAGCIMYEQALRLSAESGAEALEKQCHCYVAAITALSLVDKKDAWIVRPLPVLEEHMDTSDVEEYNTQRKVEVLELKDLQKELVLCRARLKLVIFSPEHSKSSSLSTFNANEVVGVLTNSGLFKDALEIASLYGISKVSVLSGLAGACVRMDESPSDHAWDWLRENGAADLGDGSAATLAWRLLESLLMKEEVGRESILHRCIATKLIHLGVFLPHWLVASYKKRNAAELLRLLLMSGRLEEAAELGVEYVSAVLGKGKERFGLESALLPQHPAVWLPLNVLDLILLELEAHSSEDDIYKEWHKQLNEVFKQYLSSVASVSQDKLKLLQEEVVRLS